MSYERIIRAFADGYPAELSDQVLAERFGCRVDLVARVRQEQGCPAYDPEARTLREAFEANYAAHVEDVEGGHRRWTGPVSGTGSPMVELNRGRASAARIAFRLAHGREPVGCVKASCPFPRCVAPGCQADRPMREERRWPSSAGAVIAA